MGTFYTHILELEQNVMRNMDRKNMNVQGINIIVYSL